MVFFRVVQELNNEIDGECLIELIGWNKVQVYRSVKMPQLHTCTST